ncbi:MAG: helix-turn-helix domain-containing protein, partial [Candidatus Eremiobacteraeota bacterium]|nr:helix-turn-helix domain-containing protein [Candidatus Eremiobacteraeota bacterium]
MRRARGLSQRALAQAAGITRQAVGAIENGAMQPGVGTALALARTLGLSVEDLFGEAQEAPAAERVALGTIDEKAVLHRLDRDHLAIEPAESAGATAFVAGCDVAVGLLSRHAMLRSRDLRVLWLSMTNRAALDALKNRKVHAAVVHGSASLLPAHEAGFAAFELATTEEGWLVARAAPTFRGAGDVIRRHIRL